VKLNTPVRTLERRYQRRSRALAEWEIEMENPEPPRNQLAIRVLAA
jgi:hypothetical protein